jgi:uncharacterized protein YbbC (DUF1343 family)
MNRAFSFSLLFLLCCGLKACSQKILTNPSPSFRLGAQQTQDYFPLLKNKKVALVVNHTTTIGEVHLVDSLLATKINIVKIFAPEHGFRGTASNGEHIANGTDPKTGITLVSLYGKNKKPSKEQLADVDLVLYDIQDVGARFYTFTTTMHYVMDACAEYNKPLIILDRPNPTGHLVDGPVLNKKFASMVGWNTIPVLHGLTSGELAAMINGENWLECKKKCDLTIVKNQGYKHTMRYVLPIAPSPNLPNQQAINLYASLCLFEGLQASVGRGTNMQFQVVGADSKGYGSFTFTPQERAGALDPPLKNKLCYGLDLRNKEAENLGFSLKYIQYFLKKAPNKDKFLLSKSHFDRLAGTDSLRNQLWAGWSEKKIRETWQKDLTAYHKIRNKYLLYP